MTWKLKVTGRKTDNSRLFFTLKNSPISYAQSLVKCFYCFNITYGKLSFPRDHENSLKDRELLSDKLVTTPRLFISFFSHHPKHWPHLHFLEHGGCGPHNTKSLGSPSSTPFSSKTGEMSSLPLCMGLGCKSRCPVTASWGGVQVQGLKFKLGQSQSVLPSFLSPSPSLSLSLSIFG